MKTLGIDLASHASRTAACIVEWGPTRATLAVLATSGTDDELIAMAEGCDGIGIDAPFGWPEPFVEFVRGWHEGQRDAPASWTSERRDELRYRVTDMHVARRGGRPPLSVSSDRIALPALRCTGLLHRLGVEDRSGGGRVNEVYPAAALRTWGLRADGYKGERRREVLAALAHELLAATTWLDVQPADRARLERDDNALDALACALVARAARLGLTEQPPPELHARAMREGWIAVPTVPLDSLLG